MKKDRIYFTIAGTSYYFGSEFMEPGMHVTLIKEPDNPADAEAIRVEMPGLGKVGYVANSPGTVQGESMSAGRIYDKIGDIFAGIIRYVTPAGVICELYMVDEAEEDL